VDIIQGLVSEDLSWDIVKSRFPIVATLDDEDEEGEGKKEKVKVEKASPLIVEQSYRAAFTRPNPNY